MSARLVLVIGEDGLPMHMILGEHEAWPVGGVEIPRLPEPFEEWNGEAYVVPDSRAKADWTAGAEHIAEARMQKRLEAIMIKKVGNLPDGLIALEALARGMTQDALATVVLDKAADFAAAELQRQEAQGGGSTEALSG